MGEISVYMKGCPVALRWLSSRYESLWGTGGPSQGNLKNGYLNGANLGISGTFSLTFSPY